MNDFYDLTISIVTYYDKNYGNIDDLVKCLKSILKTKLKIKVIIVDNSSKSLDLDIFKDERIEYIFNGKNLGFGKSHNIAIKKVLNKSKYHLILNPDIFFEEDVLFELKNYMDFNKNIAAITPKILYPNGKIQYLCKLLPTPFDLIFRRFIPFKKYLEKRNFVYELRFTKYNKEMKVPVISGCFIFLRTDILKKINGFDERFFLYLEDVDLCRRILKFGDIVFYPKLKIFHKFERGSYKKLRFLIIHMISAIKYFNKWGWILDKEREKINKKFLKELL
ncbi:MAG: glycosyltransferase family 2 protein [Candidatus Aenigmarchaeota archaeon]|nr:glycosyltransferase family 2 protein [Candidatus Aenigmarchaeota archaeon]MBU5689133.1 glycosyltransferase family 2 protein [Candidatus Aenigmarchaeota archaeon]